MYVFANLKMNCTDDVVSRYISHFDNFDFSGTEFVLCPSFVSLYRARDILNEHFSICAQNVNNAGAGSFTGEVSASMLASVGVKYCLVGHSERRTLFAETDVHIRQKIEQCLASGIVPVLCVGETKAEKDAGDTCEVLKKQIFSALDGLDLSNLHKLILAYEPVWAIGTGVTASTADIEYAVGVLSDAVRGLGVNCAFLYGGSINTDNFAEISKVRGIDGLLIGGASLDIDKLSSIIKGLNNE